MQARRHRHAHTHQISQSSHSHLIVVVLASSSPPTLAPAEEEPRRLSGVSASPDKLTSPRRMILRTSSLKQSEELPRAMK